MLESILRFTTCCRNANLQVSPAELIIALQHLSLVNPLQEREFKTALKSNFAKSRRDQAIFERVFTLFFKGSNQTLQQDKTKNNLELDHLLEQYKKKIAQHPKINSISPELQNFLLGQPEDLLQEITSIQGNIPNQGGYGFKSNLGQVAKRLEMMLKISQTRSHIMDLVNGQQSKYKAQVAEHFNSLLDQAYDLLRNEPRPPDRPIKESASQQNSPLGQIPFANLSPEEEGHLRTILQQLVRKLKDISSRRFASRNKGSLDIKKTLRAANRFQGIPMKIKNRDKPLRKSKVVTLCDVSGSVRSAARFMLNLLYSLQECFSKVQSFIFVAEILEVTEILNDLDVESALEQVLGGEEINYFAATDYGQILSDFKDKHLQCLTAKTTLIIIGDARSNHLHPREEILRECKERVKRLVWLNPEPRELWGTGDSEAYSYLPYCNEMRPCWNLNQLSEFVKELIC